MPTAQKANLIEQAKDWYGKSSGVVFADYRGLSVKELQALRSQLKAKGGDLHIVKNTLFRIAAGEDVVANLPYEFHNGPTAIAFIYQNESECAKVMFDFVTSSKKLAVKGGLFGGKVVDTKQVEAISKLPSKEVLIAQVIGAIAAPLTNLVGVIEALYADPIRVIGAVADKVAEGSPVPVAKAEAPAAEAPAVSEEAAAPATEELATEGSDTPASVEEAPTEAAAEEAPAAETPEE